MVQQKSLSVLHLVKTAVGAAWAYRQMRELVKLGVEVHVAIPDGPHAGAYRDAQITTHHMPTDLPVGRPWLWPERAANLRNLVARIQPDLIHSHFVGSTLTMRLALGRRHPIPRVFQVPGPLHLEHAFFRRMELLSAGPADYWIGSCRWTCQAYCRSGIANDRVFLSYYGTDLQAYAPRAKGKLRSELGIPAQTKIAGMVAFMYPPKRYLGQTRGLKGHEDLIDALALCRERGYPIHGVFVGGPWKGGTHYWRRVCNYARKRCPDAVTFLGTRNDVADLYPDFDVAVHPSHSENVGGAVESLLAGLPTITTDVGGFVDLIEHGQTGWLVPARAPGRLAERLIEVSNLTPADSRAVSDCGQRRARQLFDVRETAAEVKHIYQRIIPLSKGCRSLGNGPTSRGKEDVLAQPSTLSAANMGLPPSHGAAQAACTAPCTVSGKETNRKGTQATC